MTFLAALLNLLLTFQAASATPDLAGRWEAGGCNIGFDHFAQLNRDGTYVEAGGHGRWRIDGGMLVIQVLAQPTRVFESRYPELLALDADRRIRILGPNLLEAQANGLVRQFHRCETAAG